MKKALFLSIMVVVASLAVSREAPKVDPNHLQTGGYGY